jgi:hypothetical protein
MTFKFTLSPNPKYAVEALLLLRSGSLAKSYLGARHNVCRLVMIVVDVLQILFIIISLQAFNSFNLSVLYI